MSKEYYASPRVSQSFLKNMYQGLGKIHKYEKMGERNYNLSLCDSTVIGSGVDCKITTPEYWDTEFIIWDKKKPSDSIIKLFSFLNKGHEEEDLKYLPDHKERIKEYLENIKYDGFGKSRGTFDKVMIALYKEESFWDFLQKAKGKSILDPQRLHIINHATDVLLNHRFTKEILEYKCQNQVWLELDYKGIEVKGLLDRVLINDSDYDHVFQNGLMVPAHSITVLDIKTGRYRPENINRYMDEWRVDIQLAFYTMLAKSHYKDYYVNNPLIVYTQNSTFTNYPVIKELTDWELNGGQFGMKGENVLSSYSELSNVFSKYGFEQCIEIYKYYLENGWDIDWQINMNNGLC